MSPARDTRAGATAAGNRRLAVSQALRLLTLVPVPAGAVRLGAPPRPLSGPAMGTPMVTSLIDVVRSWRVAMPFAEAAQWLLAHRPRGLSPDGSSILSGRAGATISGYGYGGPASPAWQSAELDIEVAAAGPGASVMRADGLVVWLNPVPVRDTGPGPRLRVTVTGGCPPSDARDAGVTNHDPALARRLLPDAMPAAGLECRYYGLNGHPWRLRSATRLTAARARREARSLARLPLSHTEGAEMSCPMDDGSAEVVALAYPGRADADVWIEPGGCGGTSNGYIVAG